MDCCQRLNHVLWRGWVYWLRAILSERILYHTEENEQSGNQLRYFGSDCILLHIQPSIASCYFDRFCVLFLGWDEKRRTFHWLFYFVVYFHIRSEEHTSELQSRGHLVCRLLLDKKKRYD